MIYEADIPPLLPCGTISVDEYSSICLDVLEGYNIDADIHLPDGAMKIYFYEAVVNDGNLDRVDSLTYVPEIHDCDDFAAELYGEWAGLVWTDVHALNFFIDENRKFWFVEPQSQKIADKLDDWQGKSVRFLIGR